jgi:hypothetical protein
MVNAICCKKVDVEHGDASPCFLFPFWPATSDRNAPLLVSTFQELAGASAEV